MEKALGTRMVVCCSEVLPLRPFTLFCLVSNAFPDFGSVGWSERKKPNEKKWRRKLKLGDLVPQHNNMRNLEMTRRG